MTCITALQVSPEENVVFILLVSNIIALSVLDIAGLENSSRSKLECARQKNGSLDEWGKCVAVGGTLGQSDSIWSQQILCLK